MFAAIITTLTLSVCAVGADKPVLIQSPSIQRVTEGHKAWFCCTISNIRPEDTDLHWYRKLPGQNMKTMELVSMLRARSSTEKEYRLSERFQSYRDTSNSSFTLTVTDVVHNDSAVYYCRVWGDINGNGAQLIVTNPADDPVLVQDPPISKVPEGVTVQLHCALYNASVTVTDVQWYHQRPGNKSEWALSHFVNDSVSRSGCISDRFQSYRNVVSNSYILTISNTSISDTAVYNCSVWSYIYGGGTQLNVTEMSRAPSYLAWLILAVVLGVLAVTGGIFLIRRRAFRNHPSHPPTETDHRSSGADYENVSLARDVPGSGGHQVDSNNTYMALQRPTQSIYGHLQADNKPPSRS
ncbi:uncharacterized protein LOC134350038 isoform X2 [Mobula hypostoma]|uniref:uncharacterized protein LOC134350038 isoform X2 n=1 Tax=Mobula hypostoma TaxID=723540 RepID=UPI002FC29B9E